MFLWILEKYFLEIDRKNPVSLKDTFLDVNKIFCTSVTAATMASKISCDYLIDAEDIAVRFNLNFEDIKKCEIEILKTLDYEVMQSPCEYWRFECIMKMGTKERIEEFDKNLGEFNEKKEFDEKLKKCKKKLEVHGKKLEVYGKKLEVYGKELEEFLRESNKKLKELEKIIGGPKKETEEPN
jgi:hypothetical protein